jgi:PAS domain S-box-containing protein
MSLPLDETIYVFAGCFQLAAIIFAARMIGEVKDRRPWILVLAALSIMFVLRCVHVGYRFDLGYHLQPASAVIVSVLLFASLFFIRTISVAERESENRYRSLVELSPDAIFVNAGNQIVYLNPAALRFFGADNAEQLLGKSPLELVSPESAELIRSRIEALNSTAPSVPVVEETWVRLDGRTVYVEAAAASIPWKGDRAIQVVLRDISERKRAEREKSRLLASERVARSNAEHANRMKDEFLATLSHELRTPLNAILGWSQLLRTGDNSPEELHQGLDTIERNAKAQTQLIEDLLDMSRIISGKLRLDIQQVMPSAFITAAIDTVRPAADAKSIRLDALLDPAAGPISGDPNRLQQIIWNLLSNAVKFTPRAGRVQITLRRTDGAVEITVTDSGQGIAAEFLPYLFERFRQADATTTRRHGGLGLGLSIAKQLVDLHGGSLIASSPGQGQGSTFTVQLPLTAPVHEENGEEPNRFAVAAEYCRPDLAGVKVLVVDDESDARELIRRILLTCHAAVFTAGSAIEAMAMLDNADVLISDIGMPEIDGYEFLNRVRSQKSPHNAKLPAIALTAFARSEDRTRALLAGYQVHISKPVSALELIATVASVAGRTGTPQPSRPQGES